MMIATDCTASIVPSGSDLYAKEIVYDRETRDYAMFLNGELVGYARTYGDAENTLNELVFTLLVADADHEADKDAHATAVRDDAADVDALAAEIAADYTDLGDEDATATAVMIQPLLARFCDAWDDWAARQWSAGMAAEVR